MIPPVQAAWCSIRSQKRRGRLLSPSVKSIACGRPGGSIEGKGDRAERTLKKKAESQGHLVQVMPRLSFVGVHVFAHWLAQHNAFGPVVARLTQAALAHKEAHPDDAFALLHHRESTILHRFEALFFAPLLGIDRLSEWGIREHPLQTLIGHGYQSSTLSQFLGQLERVDAAESLMPVLVAHAAGPIIYVDGHMVAYCQQVAEGIGSVVFVIDRAVNAVALAQAFAEKDLGLLCMLDDNEHRGLGSFETTLVETLEDGTRVYSGPWKACRQDAPRHFVIVAPTADKTLVDWGTPKVKEALDVSEWPRVYRERNAIQELSFKSMIAHGGLEINYGRKTILGPDRHHQRKQEHLAASLETAHERVNKKEEALKSQQAKVAASEAKGHGRRLEQRQGKLVTVEHELKDATGKQAKLSEQVATLGPAGQRADRDFRKQTIMTIRTLFLENMLRAFLAALLATLPIQVSLPQVLSLLFERSGSRMETPSQVVYWVNTAGLSQSNR